MLEGYRLSSRHLFLSQNELFFLLHGHEEGLQEESKKYNLIEMFRFTFSTCYLARNSYWEHIAHYPTANLLEIRKIVQAEVAHIAPMDGQTYAYIINLSNNRTTVLYCCFPEKVMALAKSFNLWRLLPETLPYYRYLFDKVGVYRTKLNTLAFNNSEDKYNLVNDDISLYSELLIKVDTDTCSSLPIDRDSLESFSITMMEEATILEKSESENIFNKFNLLNVLDFTVQAIRRITGLVNKKGYLVRYVAIVFIALLLTFIVGKSAFLTWNHSHLTEKIAESKNAAVGSLKLSNELKVIKTDINKINRSIALQVSKSQLLKVLSHLVEKDSSLEFSVIDISTAEMQLRGVSNNASNLLTTLSNINGFNQVEFNSPPAGLKEGGERFFIKLRFDENVRDYEYVVKNELKSSVDE